VIGAGAIGASAATWYDIACRVFDVAGRADLLEPCTTEVYRAGAPRPRRSVLDTTKYERGAHSPLPSWENAFERFLEQVSRE